MLTESYFNKNGQLKQCKCSKLLFELAHKMLKYYVNQLSYRSIYTNVVNGNSGTVN